MSIKSFRHIGHVDNDAKTLYVVFLIGVRK